MIRYTSQNKKSWSKWFCLSVPLILVSLQRYTSRTLPRRDKNETLPWHAPERIVQYLVPERIAVPDAAPPPPPPLQSRSGAIYTSGLVESPVPSHLPQRKQHSAAMKTTLSAAVVASLAASSAAFAFTASSSSTKSSSSSSSSSSVLNMAGNMPDRLWDSMVDKTERSKACPWLPRPKNLDGSYVGDQGFDPFYLSSIPKNFAGFLQPPSWEATNGIDTLYWMRESELKHCRIAMMAVFGWLATDGAVFGFPVRFPGEIYSVESIPNGYVAHDILVQQGSMGFMLWAIGFVEVCTGACLVQVSKGELDREAGDFGFDPMNFLKGKSKEEKDLMKLKEINNGRLAMLAFGGLATQTALGDAFQAPPYHYFP